VRAASDAGSTSPCGSSTRSDHTLGRHRPADPRQGWISGLDEPEGERHPTRGGLRIGKPLPERGPRERYDPQLEWDSDGQYFHYLTQWMHALHRVSQETGDYLPLAARITGFWADPANRRDRTWSDHRDINEVMLATSLAPGGYLGS
jgi:hypothetical protein